ncbi:sigma factor [Paenibacillus sp. VCA1]|uniref:sigma factor n=1 Tax=Paenibacillus sp. VCA1 TaxID=3039148 RepID=UPI002871A2A2|nr:sigma factor [Paenibacillus sp. VCA1]MDR9852951.1 sigma factor [Paenibacillus sp. VCA1]
MEINENIKMFLPTIRAISYANSRSTGIPKEDFESELCEATWNALRSYDPNKGCSTKTWVMRHIKQATCRLIKSKHGTHYRRVRIVLDAPFPDDPDSSQTTQLTDNVTTEEDFFARKHKKEADQRQLIDSLVHSGSEAPDATTTAIVEAFLAQPSASDAAIAKSLGIHPETVKRKLRKLARRYDANRFGNIYDYLAV